MMIEAVDAGDWESEANERIDRLRKRDVTIEVKSMRMVVMVIIVRMVDGGGDHDDDGCDDILFCWLSR